MTDALPDLSGKYALVTGASRGIGAAAAVGFAKAGAHVILLARTVGGLEEVDDNIRTIGGQATIIPQDLMKLAEIDKLGPALADKFGGLDILFANAGALGTLGPLPHATVNNWQQVMTVNLTANFHLIRTLDPLLQAAESGRAIFTTSGLSRAPMAYWGPYCTSKAALDMMVKCYALEVEKTNLRVNVLDPGVVDTAMLNTAFPGGYPGETAQPEDLVPTILALASPDCDYHGEIVNAA